MRPRSIIQTIFLIVVATLADGAMLRAQSLPWIVTLTEQGKQQLIHQRRSAGPLAVPVLAPRDEPANLLYKVDAHDMNEGYLRALRAAGHVAHYERDAIGYACGEADPNDPVFSKQWYLSNDGTLSIFAIQAKAGADIDLLNAWSITRGDSTVTVAILDTGLSLAHPEFAGRLWTNKNEIPENNKDDDGNGFTDDRHGWNFVSDSPRIDDDNGHGTAIAGVIAANPDNGLAIAGIDTRCKLMICKVLTTDQSGYYSDWAAGIHYAVENGADVINMSVAGEEDLKILSDAIAFAYHRGVLVLCSMGNQNGNQTYYPAGYDYAFATGATSHDDHRSRAFNGNVAAGSNYGNHIDVVAPGDVIYGLNRTSHSANTLWAGTSMATAVSTGVASLVLSVNPNLSAGQLKGILMTSADDEVGASGEDTPGWDAFHGFGRVNAFRAVAGVYTGEYFPEADNLVVYPNPASGELTISLLLPSVANVAISMVDTQGRSWNYGTHAPASPLLRYTVELAAVQPGVYTLIVAQGERRYQERFVVIR